MYKINKFISFYTTIQYTWVPESLVYINFRSLCTFHMYASRNIVIYVLDRNIYVLCTNILYMSVLVPEPASLYYTILLQDSYIHTYLYPFYLYEF
jgi:hypothetical protein